jgi:hypothetical protein
LLEVLLPHPLEVLVLLPLLLMVPASSVSWSRGGHFFPENADESDTTSRWRQVLRTRWERGLPMTWWANRSREKADLHVRWVIYRGGQILNSSWVAIGRIRYID